MTANDFTVAGRSHIANAAPLSNLPRYSARCLPDARLERRHGMTLE